MKVSLAAQVMNHTFGASPNAVAFLGNFGADYAATGVSVEEVDRLFDSFNSVKYAPPRKQLLGPLSNDK
jgi:hypothetical protein